MPRPPGVADGGQEPLGERPARVRSVERGEPLNPGDRDSVTGVGITIARYGQTETTALANAPGLTVKPGSWAAVPGYDGWARRRRQ